jgi:hypothetical protein
MRDSQTTTGVTKIVSHYKRVQSILIWCISIGVLGVGQLQATAKNVISPDTSNNSNLLSELETEQRVHIEILHFTNDPKNDKSEKKKREANLISSPRYEAMNSSISGVSVNKPSEDSTLINSPVEQKILVYNEQDLPRFPISNSGSQSRISSVSKPESPHFSTEQSSTEQDYSLKSTPILIAAPENFNPGLRLPPAPPAVEPSTPSMDIESISPAIQLQSLTTDFRRDKDNFGQLNQFIEQTAQFRLQNGNQLRFRTGFNYFDQQQIDSITNIPLYLEWQGKINQVTLVVGGGVDTFDRLPTAVNFNAKVEAPFAIKVTPSGQLQSGVIVSAVVEQKPYKFNAQTLDNQITAWRYGPSLYWQIDSNTSLYSSLRLGNYNDGNFEQQSFSRLERKFGQFFVAANVFNWNYTRDVENTKGYFSPPDFLVYNGEVGWEGNVLEGLRCRLAATLGQQRLQGEWDIANSYQARCTAKLSPSIEADIGYAFSNVQSRQTEGSAYNNQSFTGQLRIKF